ncbi:antirestriction protein ArdA [Dermabacter hominis]|uniref:antirestriction protein ArdA n=1 Tax=Dermabacter hominis TaxID=36740 RepID=UPI002432A303|nr:antirestriction protein ArdA [Dermabacter hominis]
MLAQITPKPVPAYYDGPKAWIGCLSCYNNGELIGEWFDAAEAADVTLDDIHAPGALSDACEELWAFDVDGLPVSEEMDPIKAANWGNLLNSVEEILQPSFYAWIEAGAASYDAEDMPDVDTFHDAFVGTFSDFREYSDHLADETILYDANEQVMRYFNYEQFAHDLAMDFVVEPLPDGDVAVFHA